MSVLLLQADRLYFNPELAARRRGGRVGKSPEPCSRRAKRWHAALLPTVPGYKITYSGTPTCATLKTIQFPDGD